VPFFVPVILLIWQPNSSVLIKDTTEVCIVDYESNTEIYLLTSQNARDTEEIYSVV